MSRPRAGHVSGGVHGVGAHGSGTSTGPAPPLSCRRTPRIVPCAQMICCVQKSLERPGRHQGSAAVNTLFSELEQRSAKMDFHCRRELRVTLGGRLSHKVYTRSHLRAHRRLVLVAIELVQKITEKLLVEVPPVPPCACTAWIASRRKEARDGCTWFPRRVASAQGIPISLGR